MERDYSHPALVGWCGLNETWEPLTDHMESVDDATRAMFLAAKAMDTSRPVLDASGYSHRGAETDIYDSHDYEQDPAKFARHHAGLASGQPYVNKGGTAERRQEWSYPYGGQPFFLSEFGGVHWNPAAQPLTGSGTHQGEEATKQSWGYGASPRKPEEFYARFEGLCRTLLENPHMFGYCYTQLTDVYQEENGLFFFDRREKFDLGRLRAVQERPAAIETAGRSDAPAATPAIPVSGQPPQDAPPPDATQSFARQGR